SPWPQTPGRLRPDRSAAQIAWRSTISFCASRRNWATTPFTAEKCGSPRRSTLYTRGRREISSAKNADKCRGDGKMRPVRESAYGEFRNRRQETLWHRLNRLLIGLVIVAVLVTVALIFLPLLDVRR